MSPIFYAIRLNNSEILELVCDSKQGAFISRMMTGKGYSPIQYAVSLGLDDMVNHLSIRE
jgi:hypothetical protein